MGNFNKNHVTTLDEDFERLGLNPERVMTVMDASIDTRAPGETAGTIVESGDPRNIEEFGNSLKYETLDELPEGKVDVIEMLPDGSALVDVTLDEGVRRVRIKRGAAARKAKKAGRIYRRKKKGKLARKAKIHRGKASVKRATSKRRRKRKKLGIKAKKGVRTFLTHDDRTANLIEELNSIDVIDENSDYVEAMDNACFIAGILSDRFERDGLKESSAALEKLSERFVLMAEALETGKKSPDDLEEHMTKALEGLITALRAHESSEEEDDGAAVNP